MPRKNSEQPTHEPIDPADPLIVRYADRSRGWGRAMDRIDRKIQANRETEDTASRPD